ncbi:MAG: hypothetical protein KJ906_03810 [Nanoarchaeota archaeon]|nr:hypothetical protein [Nanoarchaeota archaeon]
MKTEIYELPQGRIGIFHSDKNLSFGFLELEENQELNKHSRPVDEELIQIKGISEITLFEETETKTIMLKEGEKIIIPANTEHIHANKMNEKSLTFWKFEGDITEIIDKIREANK